MAAKVPTFEGFGRVVPAEGPQPAAIMFLGEATGYNEDIAGHNFIGNAGHILDSICAEVGIKRADVRIWNAVPRRPPENRKPKDAEVKFFRPALAEEIGSTQPKVIVALGDTALYALTGKRGITKQRGIEITTPEGWVVLPTFHPQYAGYDPSQRAWIVQDLRRAKLLAYGEIMQPAIDVQIVRQVADIPPAEQAALILAPVVSYDVETTGLDPLDPEKRMVGVGVSIDPTRGYFFLEPAWCSLGAIFGRNPTKAVAHNGKFDNRWLRRYDVRPNQTFDTMLAAFVLNENRSTYKLERLAVEVLGVEPYHAETDEDLGDGRAAEIPVEMLAARCVRDVCYTLRLYHQQRKELLQDAGMTRAFMHLMMPASRLLERCEDVGLPLDLALLEERRQQTRFQAAAHLDAVTNGLGHSLNLRSTKQLGDLLFTELALPMVKLTKGGKPSTDEEVLTELKDKSPFVAHIVEHRKCENYLSRYYDKWAERQRDGRIHGDFYVGRTDERRDVVKGTRTGRLSSDLQQIPKQFANTPEHYRVKDVVRARPGYTLLEADGSQIELRVMAWQANEPTMLAAFRERRDLHMETARDVLRIPNPTKEDRSKAKPVNFGFLYRMGPEKFVKYAFVEYGIRFTLAESTDIQRRFFVKYAGLPAYYMKQEAETRRAHLIRTPFGRVRHLPDILSANKERREAAVRQAINTPTQATASDLNTLAILEAAPRLPAAIFLLPYHDASLWEVPVELGRKYAAILKEIWVKDLPRIAREKFKVEIPVPLDADVKMGEVWGKMEELKDLDKSASVV